VDTDDLSVPSVARTVLESAQPWPGGVRTLPR
jgi:hypothetical protein